MSYTTLQTIAIICYMISGGFLAVSALIFFLWDMRDIIGRLTGSSQRKALAKMRSGETAGKTGKNVVDMSALEKSGALGTHSSGRLSRRSGRVSKGTQNKSEPLPRPEPRPEPSSQSSTPDYFGAPYPNKTPPAPVRPAVQEPQTSPMEETVQQTTVIQAPVPASGETVDLEQWQQNQAVAEPAPVMVEVDDAVEPVEMRILDDIVLIHTESFIEI